MIQVETGAEGGPLPIRRYVLEVSEEAAGPG
jgi:hypothetical protein